MIKDIKIALLHGHDEDLLRLAIKSEIYDFIACGHTHKAVVVGILKTIVVNLVKSGLS